MKNLLIALCLFAALPSFGQGSVRTINTLSQLLAINPAAVGVNSNTVYSVLALDANNPYPAARIARNWRGTAYTTNYANVYAAIDGTQWVFDDRTDSEQNILYWQAKPGDGNDDTANIQAAMDSGAKKIVIPTGRFDISGNGLLMSNVVWFTGVNRHASALYYNGTNYCLTISSGTTNTQNIGPRVSELFFFGRSDVYTNAAGLLQITKSTRGTVERCNFSWDRDLGYPVPNSKNIWFNEQAWIWSVTDCQIGYADVGISMTSTNPLGSSVNSISITGGEIFGNRYGVLAGSTNTASTTISSTHLLSNLWIKDVAIEANGAYGVWLNGVEQVTIDSIYTEANGHLYKPNGTKYFTNELRSADIVLGNQYDTSTNFSCINVAAKSIRFADSTNAVIMTSGEFINLEDNIWTGPRGTNILVNANVRNAKLSFNNKSLSQLSRYPTIDDPGRVLWTERMGTANDPAIGANSSYPFYSTSASLRTGDDDVIDGYTQNRIFDLSRYNLVQTRQPNESVGFVAGKYIQSGGNNWYPRIGFWTDGTNAHFGSKSELSGTTLPLIMDINGTPLFTLTASNNFLPNKVGIALAYSTSPTTALDTSSQLTVAGGISILDTPHYYGASWRAPVYHLGFAVTNSASTMGLTMLYRDADQKQFYAVFDPSSNVVNIGTAHPGTGLTNGHTPIKFRNPEISTAALTIDLDGVWLGDRATNIATALANATTRGWNGVTNVGSVLQANIAAGANVTLSTNSTTGTITIAASGGGSGPTNGTAVYVDTSFVTTANFVDSAELNPTYSGTNVTYAIVANSIATNKIDSTFYNFINGKQSALTFGVGTTNSGGAVTAMIAPGSNVTFTTNANTITISAASGGGSTNGTPVYVNGVQPAAANFTNSTEITSVLTGTNVTHAIVANSIATNKIDSTFYTFINNKLSTVTATNGVTNSAGIVQSALIAGSNITLSTNAGAITIASTASGGGGPGTNIFVNNVLKQPAKLTNEPTATGGVIWITNAAGDIKAYATNLPSGGTGYLPLTAGSTVPLTGSLYFYPNATATQVILGNEQDVTAGRRFVGLQSAGGRFEIYDMTTNTYTVSQTLVSIDPVETVTNIFTFGTLGGKEDWFLFNAEKFEINGTNVMALINSKGTGGGGGTNRMIQTWTAAQAIPPTNSASIPAFLPKGNGIPYYCYDGSTANQLGFLAKLPATRNYASGIEIVLDVASDTAISTSNVVMQAQYQLLSPGAGTVETQNYTGTVLITNTFPGAAGVETNFTFTIPSWNTFMAGQRLLIDIQRVPGSASDTNSASKVCLGQVTMNTISP